MDCAGLYRDSHGYTNKQHIGSKTDWYQGRIFSKLVVQAIGDGATQGKRESHAGRAHTKGNLPIGQHDSQVDFETDQEQEENQAKIGSQRECGHRGFGEDGI